ncbi:MAG TPA: sulfatase-like hydrolase/transferase [Polyangiaceae bacterium]
MKFGTERAILALAASVCAASVACQGGDGGSPMASAAPKPPPAPPPVEPPPAAEGTSVAQGDRELLVERLPGCEIEHYGRLVDLGLEASTPWTGFRPQEPGPGQTVLRDGASYLQATTRNHDYLVWLDEPLEKLRVTLRGRAAAARRVQVSFDGKRLGVARLPEGDPRAFDLPELAGPITPGLHRVSLSFTGVARGERGLLAELDWLRVANARDHREDGSYAAPTLNDILENVAIAGTPRRTLVLRAPSTVRCFLQPSSDAKLRVALGLWGGGRGVAQIVARREGEEPVALENRRLAGGDSNVWTPVEVDLARFAGEPISLEFHAIEATRGGRVAFGDPELARRSTAPPPAPPARVVVVVLLSSVEPGRVPPWGPSAGLSGLSSVAHAGVAFGRYRAPTTVPAGVLTTLLTGLLPRAHGVEAPMLRVPPTLRTLPTLLKEANGSAALFTSVPTSFAPFGFDAGWDLFEAFSPVKDIAASEPFTRAASWLGKELEERPNSRHLVFVHARGAHPPWDVSREEAQQLKPNDYNGAIEPRRAGIVLGALRARGTRAGKRLVDDDFSRIRALSDLALTKQDTGLAQLVALLKRTNTWDSSLIVVLGDAAAGLPPDLPYDGSGALSEDRLAVPLIVKFPGGAFAGKEISTPVTAPDVAVTIVRALGLTPAEGIRGVDLGLRAAGRGALEGEAQNATLPGRYATRVGSWLLRGELGSTPRLCALDIDPACAVDVFAERSIAARATWLATLGGEGRRIPKELGRSERIPAELDPETRAALVVWGDIP